MAGLIRRAGPPRLTVTDDSASDAGNRYSAQVAPPTTNYASSSPMHSAVAREFEYSDPRNAAIVDRHLSRHGIDAHYSHGSERVRTPFIPQPVKSSEFQPVLIGPIKQWFINRGWYIAFPAATLSQGINRNLGLAEKTPQLDTRTSGGPGGIGVVMGPRPAFSRVQSVPRYSAAPKTYDTKGAPA